MIQSQHLHHPCLVHPLSALLLPFPVGTHLVNLDEEVDQGDEGERSTPTGSLWTVCDVWDEYRRIECEKTGAAILPTVQELYSQYTCSLCGWHSNTSGDERVVISQTYASCESALVINSSAELTRVSRETILTSYSPPGMTYSPRLRRYVPLYVLTCQAAPLT